VQCTWRRSGDGDDPVRVVPDGCIDIVWTEGSGTTVVGPNTRAFLVALSPGTRVAGVRLRPGAAPSLLGVDAAALRDGSVAISGVWGDAGSRLAAELDARHDRGRVLLSALARRTAGADAPDPLVQAAIARLEDPRAGVRRLACELSVSERQLRRRFESAVGYGPKRLGRVLRSRARSRPRARARSSGASPSTPAMPTRRTSPTIAEASPASRRRRCSRSRVPATRAPRPRAGADAAVSYKTRRRRAAMMGA
jgi:hypothetical protein